MARPSKNIVDYFPHFVNHGKTMYILEGQYGNDGYAFWFKLLEIISVYNNHFIDCNNSADWEYLLAKTKMNSEKATEIIELLVRLGSLDKDLWDHKILWSENFVKNIQDVYKRRNSKCMQKQDICKHLHIKCIQYENKNDIFVNKKPQSKVKYSKVKKSKGEESKGKVNKKIEFLYEKIETITGLPPVEGAEARRYAWNLIRQLEKHRLEEKIPIEKKLEMLVRIAYELKDGWHSTKVQDPKHLSYNWQEIVQKFKEKQEKEKNISAKLII